MLRFDLKSLLIMVNCRVSLSTRQKNIAQIGMRFGVVGFDVECPLVMSSRLIVLSLFQERSCQIEFGYSVIRLKGERLLVVRDGFVPKLSFGKDNPKVVVSRGE